MAFGQAGPVACILSDSHCPRDQLLGGDEVVLKNQTGKSGLVHRRHDGLRVLSRLAKLLHLLVGGERCFDISREQVGIRQALVRPAEIFGRGGRRRQSERLSIRVDCVQHRIGG